MQITTKQVLGILYILSWIIFVGVCVEAGGFLFNTFFDMVINPAGTRNFWEGLDLSALYEHDHVYFLIITSMMCIVGVLRCWLFYLIIKILHDKKLDIAQPFNWEVQRFVARISYLSLFIGICSWWGVKYSVWMVKQGVKMPDTQYLRLGGADVWIFMGVTLFVIAQIFKRGIEIQTENDLTV